MLRYSLTGKVLCGFESCDAGFPAVLVVTGSDAPTTSGVMHVDRAVPVAPSPPAGWKSVHGVGLPAPIFLCSEHAHMAEQVCGWYGVKPTDERETKP